MLFRRIKGWSSGWNTHPGLEAGVQFSATQPLGYPQLASSNPPPQKRKKKEKKG